MENFKIKLTTLSPVCIGNGQKLVPITDYIFDKGKIHYLNKKLINEELSENDSLMEKYIDGIIYGMDFNLKKFLEENLKLSVEEYTLFSVDASTETKKELNCIIKNADNQPYIPGSSIKGAIKTALLYDWLLTDEGKKWCKDYLNNIHNKDSRKNLEKDLDAKFNSFNLGISDSTPISSISKVIETKRLNILSGELVVPQNWEAISFNQSFTLSISNLHFSQNNFPIKNLFEKINRYSNHQLNREWDMIESYGDKINDNIYSKLVDFYADMSENTENDNYAYLRIGSGKGYYFNSVGLALFDYAHNIPDVERLLSKSGYNAKDIKSFPKTRVIELSENNPLGWVKLEIIE